MITVYGIETAVSAFVSFIKLSWNDMITVYGIETQEKSTLKEMLGQLERYDYRLRY